MTEPTTDGTAQPDLADPGSKSQPAEGGVAEAEDDAPEVPPANDEDSAG
jgi:hypothetical protein